MGWRLFQYKGAYEALMINSASIMKDALKPRLAQLLQDRNQAKNPMTEKDFSR